MRIGTWLSIPVLGAAVALAGCNDDTTSPPASVCSEIQPGGAVAKRIIVFVWDGLRPDSINPIDTPNLDKLRKDGASFEDNHATYPTLTMSNAATLATGALPGENGFFGDTLFAPGAKGQDAAGKVVDFTQPVLVEDHAVLEDLDAYYQHQLLLVGSLFQAAQAAGLKTAAIGKSGPAFLQDPQRGGIVLDEAMAYPLDFAKELQKAQIALPALSPNAYPMGELTLDPANGDPTAALPRKVLKDGVTGDPTDTSGSPFKAANDYLMNAYLTFVLPQNRPDLSVIWLRDPDSTAHAYGPGTPNYVDALHAQDALLGKLTQKLAELGLDATTDLFVLSDHGHSSVAGPEKIFPLRSVINGAPVAVDPAGYSVSGDVRLADLLTRAGFAAFDGAGCTLSPVLSGITVDGTQVYPTKTDMDGSVCGVMGAQYTTASFKLPSILPSSAVVVAPNGGSDYVYIPAHDVTVVKNVVAFLQSREEIGAIFVSPAYGDVPGTLPLDVVRLASPSGRGPDIVASYVFDEGAKVQGVPGTQMESMRANRGAHGGFSPMDVHSTLIAGGPDFRAGFTDTLPTGNTDVAPTIAHLLGLKLAGAHGRPLYEALRKGADVSSYEVKPTTTSSPDATGLVMKLPTSPDGNDVDQGSTTYHVDLHSQTVTGCGVSHTYFDWAKGVRK